MRLQKPVVYQMLAGVRREVTGAYRYRPATKVHFAIGPYDRLTIPLMIDPMLTYSTYLGGSNGPIGRYCESVWAIDTGRRSSTLLAT